MVDTIFIIGPGGVGKSTSGKILSKIINFKLIDLDHYFLDRYGNINAYIKHQGYSHYHNLNHKLFNKLFNQSHQNTIFILSSGFLIFDSKNRYKQKTMSNIRHGIKILLLPHKDPNKSADITTKRQLRRGFDLTESRERQKHLTRHPRYQAFADITIYSASSPSNIARKMQLQMQSLNNS